MSEYYGKLRAAEDDRDGAISACIKAIRERDEARAKLAKVLGQRDTALADLAEMMNENVALRAENERLLQLLRESRTHLMQGGHSEWRKRVEAALAAKESK